MTNIILLLMILLALMVLFIGFGIYFHRHHEDDCLNSRPYLDSDGDHEYYDRSIIEKKEFLRRHPEAKGKIRTLSRMFKGDN